MPTCPPSMCCSIHLPDKTACDSPCMGLRPIVPISTLLAPCLARARPAELPQGCARDAEAPPPPASPTPRDFLRAPSSHACRASREAPCHQPRFPVVFLAAMPLDIQSRHQPVIVVTTQNLRKRPRPHPTGMESFEFKGECRRTDALSLCILAEPVFIFTRRESAQVAVHPRALERTMLQDSITMTDEKTRNVCRHWKEASSRYAPQSSVGILRQP